MQWRAGSKISRSISKFLPTYASFKHTLRFQPRPVHPKQATAESLTGLAPGAPHAPGN